MTWSVRTLELSERQLLPVRHTKIPKPPVILLTVGLLCMLHDLWSNGDPSTSIIC